MNQIMNYADVIQQKFLIIIFQTNFFIFWTILKSKIDSFSRRTYQNRSISTNY